MHLETGTAAFRRDQHGKASDTSLTYKLEMSAFTHSFSRPVTCSFIQRFSISPPRPGTVRSGAIAAPSELSTDGRLGTKPLDINYIP